MRLLTKEHYPRASIMRAQSGILRSSGAQGLIDAMADGGDRNIRLTDSDSMQLQRRDTPHRRNMAEQSASGAIATTHRGQWHRQLRTPCPPSRRSARPHALSTVRKSHGDTLPRPWFPCSQTSLIPTTSRHSRSFCRQLATGLPLSGAATSVPFSPCRFPYICLLPSFFKFLRRHIPMVTHRSGTRWGLVLNSAMLIIWSLAL